MKITPNKINAASGGFIKLHEFFGNIGGNGKMAKNKPSITKKVEAAKAQQNYPITAGEKIIMEMIAEKQQKAQAILQESQVALNELVTTACQKRGLDPTVWGINYQAGKMLPIDQPKAAPAVVPKTEPVVAEEPGANGKKAKK